MPTVSSNDETIAGQKPQSEALMGHEQNLPVNKVHSGMNMTGQSSEVQAAMSDCICQQGRSTV